MSRRICAVLLTALLIAPLNVWPRDYHYSYWSDNPQHYLDAIHKSTASPATEILEGERICGGIVTHHFLASGLMVRFFAELSRRATPETIILLGPNHFHQGLAGISVSSLPWKTPFGVLSANREVAREISSAVQIPEDPEAFSGEHSVGVLIPFLKYYFPQSRVVPILIDVNADAKRLRALRNVLEAQAKDKKTLLLLSTDFSHDSVLTVADARDQEARKVVTSMDASKTAALNTDCRKGLWVLFQAAKGAGCQFAQILEHSNSALLLGRPQQPDVTSYFTALFLAEPRESKVALPQ